MIIALLVLIVLILLFGRAAVKAGLARVFWGVMLFIGLPIVLVLGFAAVDDATGNFFSTLSDRTVELLVLGIMLGSVILALVAAATNQQAAQLEAYRKQQIEAEQARKRALQAKAREGEAAELRAHEAARERDAALRRQLMKDSEARNRGARA